MRGLFLIGLLGLLACHNEAAPSGAGALRIHLVQGIGGLPDTNGYTVSGPGFAQDFPAENGEELIDDLEPGDITVSISGVVSWCQSFGASQQVSVVSGETTDVWFVVGCQQPYGTVRVITSAVGIDLDPDGFLLSVPGWPLPIGTNDTTHLTLPALVPGDLTISGIARSCWAQTDSVVSVNPVLPGDTVSVIFAFDCGVVTAFAYLPGVGYGLVDINVTSGQWKRQPLVVPNLDENNPGLTDFQYSRDGGQIAFGMHHSLDSTQVYRVPTGQTAALQLNQPPGRNRDISWSQDGGTLLFLHEPYTTPSQLYGVEAPDGAAVLVVGAPEGLSHPRWSPSGDWVAYQSATSKIAVMTPEGGMQREVASGPSSLASPDWSPDEQWLVFYGITSFGPDQRAVVWIASIDGTDVRYLTSPPLGANDILPNWSEDGTTVAFVRNPPGEAPSTLMLIEVATGEERQVAYPYDIYFWTDWKH